MYIIFCQSST